MFALSSLHIYDNIEVWICLKENSLGRNGQGGRRTAKNLIRTGNKPQGWLKTFDILKKWWI